MSERSRQLKQDSNLSMEGVLEALPVAVMVINEALEIRLVNAAAEQLLGLSSGFLFEQNLIEIIHEDAALISLIHQVLRQGHSISEFGLSLGGPKIATRQIDVRIAPIVENGDHLVISLQECSMVRQIDSPRLPGARRAADR